MQATYLLEGTNVSYKFNILNPIQVCLQWKEIAHGMMDNEFQENEEHLIDVLM